MREYSSDNLDALRQKNLDKLVEDFISAADTFDSSELVSFLTYSKENKGGILEEDARRVKLICDDIVRYLKSNSSVVAKKTLVDNWSVELDANKKVLVSSNSSIESLAKDRYKQFIFSKNVYLNEGIEDDVVYDNFIAEDTAKTKDKKRKKRAVEALNINYTEFSINPR